MRDQFLSFIKNKASIDADFILLTADLGFGVFEEFERLYPKQFLNVGVAEQLMTSLACGLAHEGFNLVTYSIGNFPTLRCLEQIRNDIIYHDSNVKIVTSGAGFSYGSLGMSHHATEDIGIIRSLPKTLIFSPASSFECKFLLNRFFEQEGVGYLRLDKTSSNLVPNKIENNLNPVLYHHGKRSSILFLSHGSTLSLYEKIIADESITENITVASVPFLARTEYLVNLIQEHDYVITTEEHQLSCGFGSFIAEIIVDQSLNNKLYRFGLKDTFSEYVGSQSYLRSKYLPSAVELRKKVADLILS